MAAATHYWTAMHLGVDAKEDFRVESNHGWTVRVYNIELIDYPPSRRHGGAARAVRVEGLHIRKDGQPGAHRRGGAWHEGEELPPNLAAVVEAARPGWWAGVSL